MWQLSNTTPFSAESSWVRGDMGQEIWLVVVKASFVVDPVSGEVSTAKNQPPVLTAASYFGKQGQSSLLEDDHFVRLKLGTDILLNGSAYSPAGQPVHSVDVAMSVGKLQKRLRVFGDRHWEYSHADIRASDSVPFVSMPILYERAFGGPNLSQSGGNQYSSQNPLGVGFAKKRDDLIGQALPNIEYPDHLINRWSNKPASAGFGAIPVDWEPRVKFAGTYDEKWLQERQPLIALDTDPRWYHQAPVDQQYGGFMSGGEKVSLYNLTPPEKTPNGQLHFKLPSMRLGFRTSFKDGFEHHVGHLHTVLFTPDDLSVSLIWHTALECHNRDHLLENTGIFMKDYGNG